MRDNQDYMRLHEIVQDYAVCSPPPRTARELKQNLWVGKLPSEECHGAVQHDVTDPTKPRTAMTIGERYETIHQPDGTCGQGWSRIILGDKTNPNRDEKDISADFKMPSCQKTHKATNRLYECSGKNTHFTVLDDSFACISGLRSHHRTAHAAWRENV